MSSLGKNKNSLIKAGRVLEVHLQASGYNEMVQLIKQYTSNIGRGGVAFPKGNTQHNPDQEYHWVITYHWHVTGSGQSTQ